jgi:hypothetical protein
MSRKTWTKRIGRAVRTAFLGVWIVPDSQVRVLSLAYQEHLFRLFHRHRINRLMHYIGIPMAMMTLYAAVGTFGALCIALLIAGLHTIIAVQHRLWLLGAVAVTAQIGFVVIADRVLSPLYSGNANFWASPWVHIFGWSFLQYSGHALESELPKPWGRRTMTPIDQWLRKARARHLVLAAVAMIPHVFVEWVSGPRNLFLVWIRLARSLGYRPPELETMHLELLRLHSGKRPVLEHDLFYREYARSLGRDPATL